MVGVCCRVTQTEASYPLLTVACQLILQVLGLQLQFGPLLDLLLPLHRQLLLLLLHCRDLGLELTHHTLRLLRQQNREGQRAAGWTVVTQQLERFFYHCEQKELIPRRMFESEFTTPLCPFLLKLNITVTICTKTSSGFVSCCLLVLYLHFISGILLRITQQARFVSTGFSLGGKLNKQAQKYSEQPHCTMTVLNEDRWTMRRCE